MEAISPNDDGNGEVALTTTTIRIMMMSIAIKKKRLRLMSFFWSQHVNIYGQGAEIDSVDNTSSTPLLLAASKGSWDSVLCLIQHGADIYSHDQNSRNFLHLAIRFGGKLHEFGCSFVEVNTYHLFFSLCLYSVNKMSVRIIPRPFHYNCSSFKNFVVHVCYKCSWSYWSLITLKLDQQIKNTLSF